MLRLSYIQNVIMHIFIAVFEIATQIEKNITFRTDTHCIKILLSPPHTKAQVELSCILVSHRRHKSHVDSLI
jgi:hypothetical protein